MAVLNYTTVITPFCSGSQVGYTVYLSNNTVVHYVLGANATTLPPALIPGYIQAYPYALLLAVLLIILIAMYKFGDLGLKNSLILATASAIVTVLGYLGVGNPYASFNLSCPNTYAPITVTVPMPQNILLATTWLGIIAIILVIASLIMEYALY